MKGWWRLSKSGDPAITLHLPVPGKPTVSVGRKEPADIVVATDKSLSRMHAELTVTDASLTIKDLGSKFGTYVDEARLDGSCELGVLPPPIAAQNTTWKCLV